MYFHIVFPIVVATVMFLTAYNIVLTKLIYITDDHVNETVSRII